MENTKRENNKKKALLLALLLLLLLLLGSLATMFLLNRPVADPVVAQNSQSSDASVPDNADDVNIAESKTPMGSLPENLPAENDADSERIVMNGTVDITAPATPTAPGADHCHRAGRSG